MKRLISVLAVMALLCLPVSAASSLEYVTDFDYALIRDGGMDGAFVYSAYENNGQTYKMGLLSEDGEQSRMTWTAQGWSELFASSDWNMTVHGDAGALCSYADKHKDTTLCPYLNISLVTLTNTETGLTLSQRYMYAPKQTIGTGGTVHMCFGNYEFNSPETLRWDGENRFIALRDESGKWGVMDTLSGTMLTAYVYADMSAVYGDYAKVSDGTAWGRLDVSGATATSYIYDSEDSFSVREELREIASGQYRVFNADNEPISAVYTASQTPDYAPKAHCVLITAEDGTKALLDLAGETVATFTSTQKVLYLDRGCYAVENYNERGSVTGVALAQVSDVPQPADTVVKGDVNFDGACDSSDVRLMLCKAMKLSDFTQRQMLAADINGDGKVTTADARACMANLL